MINPLIMSELDDLNKAMAGDNSDIHSSSKLVPSSMGDIPGVKIEDDGKGGVKMMMEMTKEDLNAQTAILNLPSSTISQFHKLKNDGKHVAVIGCGLDGKASVLLGEILDRSIHNVDQIFIIHQSTPVDVLSDLLDGLGYTVTVIETGSIPTSDKVNELSDISIVKTIFDDKPQKSKYAKGNRKYDKRKFF